MRGVALAVFAVCLSVLLAGCAFGGPASTPTPTPGSSGEWTVGYNLTNAESTPRTVAVGVVDGPVGSFELRLDGGGTRTVAPEFPTDPAEPRTAVYAFEDVSGLTVAGLEDRLSFELEPRESATGEFTVTPTETVVLVVRDGSGVAAAGLASCGGADRMFSVDFLVGSYGPAVGLGCTGG
jgi:hypothetical protein